MKKIIVTVFALLMILSVFTCCSNETEKFITPVFTEYEEPQKPQDLVFDVVELQFTDGEVAYKKIGEMRDFEFYLKGVRLRYSGGRNLSSYGSLEYAVFESELPVYFLDNTKNAEGIIVYQNVPYSFYYDENGKPYVKCLEMRFNDYFKEDKSYGEFIKWAKDLTPRLDDEDLLAS